MTAATYHLTFRPEREVPPLSPVAMRALQRSQELARVIGVRLPQAGSLA